MSLLLLGIRPDSSQLKQRSRSMPQENIDPSLYESIALLVALQMVLFILKKIDLTNTSFPIKILQWM